MLQQPNMLYSTTNKAKNEKRELIKTVGRTVGRIVRSAVIGMLIVYVFVVVMFSLG